MSEILIVSNRLPITVTETSDGYQTEASAGGLATALKSVAAGKKTTWLGWPGCFPAKKKVPTLTNLLTEKGIVPVMIPKSDFEGFYQSYSNGLLWPVCHYLIERVPLTSSGFRDYLAVNKRFAAKVVEQYKPGMKIWIHDYHLMLLPQMIREEIPDAEIGFFLHIPFPAFEIFRVLPESRELLRGLLGADLIGFHTKSYARHFKAAIQRLLGLKSDGDKVEIDNRIVRFGDFPISIDFDSFDRESAKSPIGDKLAAMRQASPDSKIFAAVDRLDYTKGVIRRLIAYEEMLKQHPDVLRRVVMVQVAVKTREHVKEYARFKKQVDEVVGRINGEFGDVDYQPVHYIAHGMSQQDLAALYKSADVMLVTPIRDGMNLVAKEYVAARSGDSGVLVLSEFAGAAEEMTDAIQVNPYDVDQTAKAMYRAFIMDEAEARLRMRALRARVSSWQSKDWADAFISKLELQRSDTSAEGDNEFIQDAAIDTLAHDCADRRQVSLLLDYDGTLVPIAATPDRALPDPLLIDFLQRLANLEGVAVHIVSGRRREDLEAWFSDVPVVLYGEHGIWKRPHDSKAWVCMLKDSDDVKAQLKPIAELAAQKTPGAFVEEKSFGLSWHHRLAEKDAAKKGLQFLEEEVSKILSADRLAIIPGKEVLEFQPAMVSKGSVARDIAKAHPDDLVIAVGDDRSDEDMFQTLNGNSVTMHVGGGESCASLKVKNVDSVRRFLSKFIDYKLSGSETRI